MTLMRKRRHLKEPKSVRDGTANGHLHLSPQSLKHKPLTEHPWVRRLPVGAEVQPDGGVHFRVWAPGRKRVRVVFEGEPLDGEKSLPLPLKLAAEPGGYFSGLAPETGRGTLYRYRLDEDGPFPDPASRFQPTGPHGASMVIDPARFRWTDRRWRGVHLPGQVIYEMHIGTFTREGNWAAAAHELPELAAFGVTVIELMPVADFTGRFGWGYDGVDFFAPTRLYGEPDGMRRFIDTAHAHGIGVILDVVYNHAGPEGSYLKEFSPAYFSEKHVTDWGQGFNYDGPDSGPVREFFLANVAYWMDEFHLDGLRLDATQNIYDDSQDHILTAMVRQARQAAGRRSIIIVAENEPQNVAMVSPMRQGGHGMDALWNDDFHHTALVALIGHNEAYYRDYMGTPQEFISAIRHGFLYQGQYYLWQDKRRGTPTYGVSPAAFITFIQNHDQIANSFRGERIHSLTSPGNLRAMTALVLLAPGTPMLFQGQEFAASTPFLYFADHREELARLVCKGRAEFLAQFRSLACPEVQLKLNDPASPETFLRSKLDFADRERHAHTYALHRDLLRLRREDAVFSAQRTGGIEGAVLGPHVFVLRYFGTAGDDRILLVNLGTDLHFTPAPEPLLAPPPGRRWLTLWSSENPAYGGCGAPPVEEKGRWIIPGQAAVALKAEIMKESTEYR